MTAVRAGNPLHTITESDIDFIAIGAAVLGTGGGGDPHVGALQAKRAIREFGEVEVISVEALPDGGFIAPVGMIGAPSVAIEKIQAEGELAAAIDLLEASTGQSVTAIMPTEIGGGNSLVPISAAAERGLPIVDGDSMGRAFPEAPMVTFHLAGYAPGRGILVDSHGNSAVIQPKDGMWAERLARVISFEMGGNATMIDYAYPGKVVKECAIPGTLSTARRIGEILLGNDIRDEDRVATLLNELSGFHLFSGKITAVERAIQGGFTRGQATLDGLDKDRDSTFELQFQNEMLLGTRNGQLAAVTPDLITVLDQVTGQPITTEMLRYGARVVVVGFPSHEYWRTEMGLATAGPGYFNYDVDYTPVEKLVAVQERVKL
ncbi:DUF917 domain-containing protein [Lysinibacter sp. HNR]|uniref:DUF917 domain-containing protein n=1 Tax=Lysinibacter sp. HNR TaxID=3031408 RepID=UPI0024352DC7|nr:DUF917 domain-containing protein [Lysinibacter sp. HNR]WGD37896.1 DUF917 domain-containing protein [Lysinibacter sp. HNR]